MKKNSIGLYLAFSFLSFGLFSCNNCYECNKNAVVEINGVWTETDAVYTEEVCKRERRKDLEDQGYECTSL